MTRHNWKVDQLYALRLDIRTALSMFDPNQDSLEMNRAANRLLSAVHRYQDVEVDLRRMEIEREERDGRHDNQ